jgi:heme/copper-type cytochrome/quinol oxidase subunit 3
VSATAVADRRRLGYPSGWWAVLMLVATEAALFGLLIGAYYYLRFESLHWPPAGDPRPRLVVPLVLAFVLVSTSVPMQLAVAAARRARLGAARLLLLAALAVQTGYLAMQLHLFVDDLHAAPPSGDAYESAVATLQGAHHAHVAVGVLLTAWILARLARGLTSYRLVGLRSIVLYWHFVNALALVVTGVILSGRA